MYTSGPEAAACLQSIGLDSVEAVLRCRTGRFAAISSTSDTLEVFPPDREQSAASVYVKRYRYPKRSQRIKAALRGGWFTRSRARFEYDRLLAMRRKGVPTVEPLAAGERRVAGLVTAGVLITRGVPGESLLSFSRTHQNLPPSERHRLIRALAEQVREVHAAGVVHGSMFWRDVLVRRTDDGGFAFTLLDPGHVKRFYLPGCRRLGYLRDVVDLAGTAMLLCTRSDRLRFAKTYLKRTRLCRCARLWLKLVGWRAARRVPSEKHRMEVNEMFVPPPPATGP